MEADAYAQTPDARAADTTDSGPGDAQGMDRNMGMQSVLCSHETPLPHGCMAQHICSGDQCTHVVAPPCTTHTQKGRESTRNSRWQNQGPAVPAERPEAQCATIKKPVCDTNVVS